MKNSGKVAGINKLGCMNNEPKPISLAIKAYQAKAASTNNTCEDPTDYGSQLVMHSIDDYDIYGYEYVLSHFPKKGSLFPWS